ncbi:hypothetical protein ART_0924 [Arthrobacter sp. PAMC 25486]|nr:hypothetical protein ART_0924 [Arthrobacter sp. PAMC 25486]
MNSASAAVPVAVPVGCTCAAVVSAGVVDDGAHPAGPAFTQQGISDRSVKCPALADK